MDRVIYEQTDGFVSILIPTKEALSFATIEQIAEKDVPKDLPYWIRPVEDIPVDRTYRNAWEIDPAWGDPDGFGGESNEFDDELLESFRGLSNANKSE